MPSQMASSTDHGSLVVSSNLTSTIRRPRIPLFKGGESVIRLSLGRRLVNLLPVAQRTNAFTTGVVEPYHHNIPCHSDQAVNKRKHCPILSIGKPSSILLRRARGPHHNTSGPARNTCILFQKDILLAIICLMSIYTLYKSHVLFEETRSTNGTERP